LWRSAARLAPLLHWHLLHRQRHWAGGAGAGAQRAASGGFGDGPLMFGLLQPLPQPLLAGLAQAQSGMG
jgi:hypothetical protein